MVQKNLIQIAFVQRFERFPVRYVWANCWLALVGLSFFWIGTTNLQAQAAAGTKIWTDATGDNNWFTGSPPAASPGNWLSPNMEDRILEPAPIPTSTDVAVVNNGTTAQIAAPNAVAQSLLIGDAILGNPSVAGSTVELLPGGVLTLSASSAALAIGPEGTLILNGGLVTLTGGPTSAVNNGVVMFTAPVPGNAPVTLGFTGTGNVIFDLTGTITISAPNNTYSGATILTAGTLQAGSTGALSPNSAFTVNSVLDLHGFNNTIGSLAGSGLVLNNGLAAAALTVGNNNTSSSFNGVLKDGTSPLQLVKIGTGTLALTGTNTYTGGTTISAGTVQLGQGGTSGSVVGDIVDNGVLAFDRSDTLTLPQNISGTGSVTQIGTGTTTLSGRNTYTGTTTVSSGSLIVDGTIASPQTVVNSGAFLGGHGTIGGSLINNGTVGQNNSPATLTVGNNFTQNAGGTLRIGVAGTAPGQHDLLAVGGHASVAGTLQLLSLGGFTLQPGDQITFLTAKNGVSGTFNNTQNGLVTTGTIVQVKVTSLANSIELDATQGNFADTPGVATNANENAVAKALDSAQGDPRMAAIFAFLNSQPLANLPHDLELIAPTQISSINATAVSVAKVQIANVVMRLAAVHAGSTGFSSAGLSLNGGTVSFEGLAGPSGSEGKSGPAVFAPTPDNRWGVFLTGLGEFTNIYSTPEASGYDVDTGGFTFGVDYRVTPNFVIGLTGGYAHTNINLDAGGNIDANGGKFGAYATLFGNGFYLDSAVTGGPSGYQTRRTALLGTASGNTSGADFNAMVAAGYDWQTGNLSIGPTASFQYSYVGLNSFSETGSLAPIAFPNQNTQSELSAFGAKATYTWKIGQVTVLPQISAAWQHEYGATAYSVIASFANGAGNSFSVTGPQIGRDSLLVGVGATVILSERIATYLYYDGEFARTNYLSNNVSGGVRISF
jgi:autotransporter-associated beta strand protein